MEIVIATYNPGKLREVRAALSSLPITFRTLVDFPNITEVPETGESYQANATLKAMGYAEQTGLLALADDSGLEVDALNGGPGVYSARFGGDGVSDEERVEKLLRAVANQKEVSRGARFVCAIAIARPVQPPQLLTLLEESCEGSLSLHARGKGGFGYDPIFIPDGYSQTFGELPAELKSRISHRGKALHGIRHFLEAQFGQT
jgi:XTP/dITP diphosphohydrolase